MVTPPPQVTFPPEECLSPSREKRDRSCDSSRPVEEEKDSPPPTLSTAPPDMAPHTLSTAPPDLAPHTLSTAPPDLASVTSPQRGAVREGREGQQPPRPAPQGRFNRFQVHK